MTTLGQILENKIVAIIRGAKPDDVLKIAVALREGGIKAVEITLNSPDAFKAIEMLSKEMEKELIIGAGTVLNASSAQSALSSGATFIISPNVDRETIQATKKSGAVSIPGAFTATEIVSAFDYGGDIIKIFPAFQASYIEAIRGPLQHIPLMPTGGVTLENIHEFQKAGAAAFGIGSALVNTRYEMTVEYLEQLKAKAQKFLQAISSK